MFVTCKQDLTSTAYDDHKMRVAAPGPLSAKEQEMADLKAAERGFDNNGMYDGSRSSQNLPKTVGFEWPPELQEAVKSLGASTQSQLVVIVSFPLRSKYVHCI